MAQVVKKADPQHPVLIVLAGIGGGKSSVPFSITGTTSNPSFMPDVGGMLSNQLGNQLKGAIPGGDKGSALEGLTGLFGKKKKPR